MIPNQVVTVTRGKHPLHRKALRFPLVFPRFQKCSSATQREKKKKRQRWLPVRCAAGAAPLDAVLVELSCSRTDKKKKKQRERRVKTIPKPATVLIPPSTLTRVACLIPPINLDYRVSRLTDKDRQEAGVQAYVGLSIEGDRGHAWLVWLLR